MPAHDIVDNRKRKLPFVQLIRKVYEADPLECPQRRGTDPVFPPGQGADARHRAPIRHHCSVALAQDAGDGRIDFPISFLYFSHE